jgi:tight adherence protein B
MVAATLVFVLVVGVMVGGFFAAQAIVRAMGERRLEQRLHEVAAPDIAPGASILKETRRGPAWMARLVEQSGVETTTRKLVMASAGLAILGSFAVLVFVRIAYVVPAGALAGAAAPFAWLIRKRSLRVAKFEEQFPDALDLMSRAIKAGHAFQTAMGMVAEELDAPVGDEFRRTFDQQNFGLPLREALDGLAGRIPLLDVRFFVTAVAIQRESGGNLSEILENLAHVVRERFKIRRQVRIHTAHGRFTGYVLMALPAALAAALSSVSPDQMQLLFREQMGQMMLAGAVVMQVIGYFWIRQVIKIEV